MRPDVMDVEPFKGCVRLLPDLTIGTIESKVPTTLPFDSTTMIPVVTILRLDCAFEK